MENFTTKLQKAENLELSIINKTKQMDYRNNIKLIKDIYDMAKNVLDDILGENYSLPIDIIKVVEELGFLISYSDISEMEFSERHACHPFSQLEMRKKIFGTKSDKICGTIKVNKNLTSNLKRLSIAHQLGIFALRNRKKIKSHTKFESYSGLYAPSNTEEMLADTFAHALLLPYHLYEKARIKFEMYRTNWPLTYEMWLFFICDEAQIPQYHAVLADQELRKLNIYLNYETAQRNLHEKLESLAILKPEEQNACLELYAIVIDNLETWGFSQSQIAETLFHKKVGRMILGSDITEVPNLDIIDFIHDFYLQHNISTMTPHKEYPSALVKDIATSLKNELNIDETGISKILGISVEDISQRKLLQSPNKNNF